jgi:choice-of-anchor C domain-containing protein
VKKISLGSAMLAIVATLALAGTTLGVQLFQNGSFENGNYAPSPIFGGLQIDRLALNSTAMTGWTVTKGDIDWVGSYWVASQGTNSVDLDGTEHTAGEISQTFDTTVNSTYVVTFDMSGNPDDNANESAVKTMTVSVGGATAFFSFDSSVITDRTVDMHWLPKSLSFVGQANATQATLVFTSTTGTGWGPVIDNVVITQTLATGAQCKNNGWKTMTDKYGTPFKNQGDCVSYYATGEKNLAF